MDKRVKRIIDVWIAAFFAIMAAACSEQAAIYEYRDLPAEGWSRTDTLSFATDTLQPGSYRLTLGIRYNIDYPYRDIVLAVDDSMGLRRDTICLADSMGNRKGYGLSGLYQYVFDMGIKEVSRRCRLRYRICHEMDSLQLGIESVGMKIKKIQK